MTSAVEQTGTEGITLIVPAYNEESGLSKVIASLHRTFAGIKRDYEILVVDDGSEDDTPNLPTHPAVRLIRHSTNRGYGAALKTGLRHANFPLIGIIDADNTYPSASFPELLERFDTEGVDMVVGARTNKDVAIPWIRRPAKWVLGHLANYVCAKKIPDINSGLRVFRRSGVLLFYHLLPNGFSFTTTITLAMESSRLLVDYIPINYYSRTGQSKIKPVRDTLNFLKLILRIALYFSPLRVFSPIAGLLIFSGLLWGLFSWLYLGRLADTSTLLLIMTGIQIGIVGLLAEMINRRLPHSFRLKN